MSVRMGTMDLGVALVGDMGDLQRTLDNADNAVGRFGKNAQQDLGKLSTEAAKSASAIDRLTQGLKGAFVGSSVAVGLITLKNNVSAAVGAITEAQVQVDRLRNGFRFGAGGIEAGAAEFAFVREEGARLGLVLNATATQYMKLVAASRGTALAGEPTREVFTAIAEAAAVMGMNADQSERSLLAVTQMMSKGKVMAEELRGQLGEQLPGAFAIAARAMGVTEVELNKMLETGQVFSADFLPKFAAQLRKELAGSVEESATSMQANLNRLQTAWQNLKQQIAQGGVGSAISQQVNLLQSDLNALAGTFEEGRKRGDGFFMSLANAGGMAAGRTAFGIVESSANALLSTLFDLSFQIDIIPDNLLASGEKFRIVSARIKEAETRYGELEARLARSPDNIYVKSELANLSRYIGALRLAQAEQAKLMGTTAGGGSIGSVGSGDTALLRAQRGQYERELAARAALRKKYATPEEKLSEEINAQKALLGSLYGPEEEARIRAQFKGGGGGGGGSRSRPKDEFATLLGRLTAKDAGLDPGFGKDLQTLFDGYSKGRIGVDAYRAAVEQLIGSQQFAKDLLDEKKKAIEKEDDANKAALKTLQGVIDAAEKAAAGALKNAQAAQDEADAIGKSVGQLHDMELARLADAAAALRQRAAIMENIDLSGRASEALREEAAATEQMAQARQRAYLRGLAVEGETLVNESRRATREESENRRDSLAQSISDGVLRGVREGSSIMDVFARELEAQFAKIVLQPAIRPVAEGFGSLIESGLNELLGAFGSPVGPPSVDPSASFARDFAQYRVPPMATGTNYVPRKMLALLHEGEAVQPRAYNPAAGGASTSTKIIFNVINQTGQNVAVAEQRQTTAPDGSRLIELMLSAVGDGLASRSGPVARGLENGYGVRPAVA